MAKKATTKTDAATVKFAKGAFYEDSKGNLWHCVNAKPPGVEKAPAIGRVPRVAKLMRWRFGSKGSSATELSPTTRIWRGSVM